MSVEGLSFGWKWRFGLCYMVSKQWHRDWVMNIRVAAINVVGMNVQQNIYF